MRRVMTKSLPDPPLPDPALPDPALPDPADTSERILILDFGSQVTQLIARRLREIRRVLRDLAILG